MSRLAVRPFINSIHINGTGSQSIAISNFEPSGGAGATLSVMQWVRVPYGFAAGCSMSKFDYGVTKRAWTVLVNAYKFRVIVSQDGGITNWKVYDSPNRIDTNIWQMIGFTWNSGTLKLFIDGVEITPVKTSDAAITTIHQNDRRVMIGCQLAANNPVTNWSGKIGASWIWSDVLTPTEVTNLYRHGVVPRDNLQGEWLFTEGSGATLADTSGNGRNGVIAGATWSTDTAFKARMASANRVAATNKAAATHRVPVS